MGSACSAISRPAKPTPAHVAKLQTQEVTSQDVDTTLELPALTAAGAAPRWHEGLILLLRAWGCSAFASAFYAAARAVRWNHDNVHIRACAREPCRVSY